MRALSQTGRGSEKIVMQEDKSKSGEHDSRNNHQERHLDRLPPEWVWWRQWLLVLGEVLVYGSGLSLAVTCVNLMFNNPLHLDCECWIYVPGVFFLIGLYMVRLLRHPFRVHETRLVDRAEAEALFQWAENIPEQSQVPKTATKNGLFSQISSLRRAGPSTWIEYRILPIEQAALEWLFRDDLVARAFARLDDLKEYDEKQGTEEEEYFRRRGERLRKSIRNLRDRAESNNIERREKALRADLRMLLETLADYDKNWAIGSEILRALLICISFTIPIFLLMGVVPVILPPVESLGFANWALLGMAGSLTAVLRRLYLGTKVDVGHTEGKNELYQAIKGTILGLVSGVLVYSMLRGGLVQPGTIVPDTNSTLLQQMYLSVFWAFMTGFTFENFFDKVQRESIGSYNS